MRNTARRVAPIRATFSVDRIAPASRYTPFHAARFSRMFRSEKGDYRSGPDLPGKPLETAGLPLQQAAMIDLRKDVEE